LGQTSAFAELNRASFFAANLRAATFRAADLFGANFTLADLGEVDFTEALFGYTVFCATNLTGAKGLEACRRGWPSLVDAETLARSGQLPHKLLRGSGLPDTLIKEVRRTLISSWRIGNKGEEAARIVYHDCVKNVFLHACCP